MSLSDARHYKSLSGESVVYDLTSQTRGSTLMVELQGAGFHSNTVCLDTDQ